LIRSDEGDLRPFRRPLAEVTQEECEAGPKPLARSRADPPHDLLGQLLAKQTPAVERIEHSRTRGADLVR
jgi:hypothetical protein